MESARGLRMAAPVVLLVVIVEAAVSIARRWPYRFGGTGDSQHMMSGFVTGGTALAPPLILIVVLAVLCVGLQAGRRWRFWSTVVMVPLSIVMAVGAFGELMAADPTPPAWVRWSSGVLSIVLSALLLVLALGTLVSAWVGRRTRLAPGQASAMQEPVAPAVRG